MRFNTKQFNNKIKKPKTCLEFLKNLQTNKNGSLSEMTSIKTKNNNVKKTNKCK